MAKRLPRSRQSLASIAHHEAGHFVVGKVVGREPFDLSIVPDGETLGQVDGVEDIYDDEASGVVVLDAKRARALITELYAGAAAQLRFGEKAALVRATASSDDAQAARILESLSLPSRRVAEETRLRARAARLVGEHWRAIVSVANELLKYRRLDFVHAELVMEIAEGRTSPATLEEYVESRELRPTIPERAGSRRERRAARPRSVPGRTVD